MFQEALEAIPTSIPLGFLAVFPVFLLVVSPITVVDAAHEFTVYRMQQYDLQGNTYGCRSALVNAEARTLQSASPARKCILIRSEDLTYERYLEVLDKGPSAVVILLRGNMSQEQVEKFISLEGEILRTESNLPILFAYEDDELHEIYDRVTDATRQDMPSALQTLLNSATSVGYQLVTIGSQSKALPEHALVNIEGMLPGLGDEEQLPTVAIVAHYDAFGVAPHLSHGANSDASGVVALLELARILGKVYSNSRTHPRHNVLFLLSAGGKFNYQGSKRWLEDAMESAGSSEGGAATLLNGAKLVLCLDSLAGGNGNSLRMHVSKPPSPGTVASTIHSNIEKISSDLYPDVDTSIVHKKIRLSADSLAWEHERYSIRRLHAVTLSGLDTHDDPMRFSILDTKDKVSIDVLSRNVAILAESLLRYLYNVTDDNAASLTNGDYSVHRDHMQAWMDFLANQPRPTQILTEDHPVVTSLEAELAKHTKAAQTTKFKADKRDPDFRFYDALVLRMSASVVRSAVFDLYVTGLVAAYISLIYLLVLKFNGILFIARKFSSLPKVKVQ